MNVLCPAASRSAEDILRNVTIAPPPEWVHPQAVNGGFQPSTISSATVLLFDDQYHVGKCQHYHRVVHRLETPRAVQELAQHRLDFDPHPQQLVIHSIAVQRGDQHVEQAALDRLPVLQREEGLEAFVIHGWITLLLLLEDVRVGDVIDASCTVGLSSTSYTLETLADSILPEQFDQLRKVIDELWRVTTLVYQLPLGVPGRRPRQLSLQL